MKRGRMQCKDIPNEAVLQAIANTPIDIGHCWRNWNEVLPQFQALMPEVPGALFYAKVDRMAMAGFLHACVHRPYGDAQCRGDVHLVEECRGC